MNFQQMYDRDYYENGLATKKSNYKNYSWERLGTYFHATAQHIVKCLKPKKLLDVGCAKGFLVYALGELGVDACGIDVSEYAVANAKAPDMVKLGTAEKIEHQDNSFDVVTALDVLEHIKEKEVPQVCAELLRVTRKWVIVRVPTKKVPGDLDAYHETIRPKEWWEEQFAAAGGKVVSCEAFVDRGVWWFNVPEYLIVVEKQEGKPVEKQMEKPAKKQAKKVV
jgi:ubiquinone/menaquinone biosynthesis C-methylase UbiE